MLGDNISFQMDCTTLIRKARAGTLPRGIGGGGFRELLGQRSFRVESAEAIVNTAVSERRAMNPDELKRVECLLAEADQIEPVIKELWERSRRELMLPAAAITGRP